MSLRIGASAANGLPEWQRGDAVDVADGMGSCRFQDGAAEPNLAGWRKSRIVLDRRSVDTIIKSDQGDHDQQDGRQTGHESSQRITACKRFGDPSQ